MLKTSQYVDGIRISDFHQRVAFQQTLKVSCVVKTKNLISADFVWIAWRGLRITTKNDKEINILF
ncbi:MAG: hypothetical protein A2X96_08230 [Syntrophobacterales bacterium GWC2_56_13]|nr:MAG: hypothetical protein A2X96_08230 [Syntrophobacterales bacterium GWC2_56_13]